MRKDDPDHGGSVEGPDSVGNIQDDTSFERLAGGRWGIDIRAEWVECWVDEICGSHDIEGGVDRGG